MTVWIYGVLTGDSYLFVRWFGLFLRYKNLKLETWEGRTLHHIPNYSITIPTLATSIGKPDL